MLDLEKQLIGYITEITIRDKYWKEYDLLTVGKNVRIYSSMDQEEAEQLSLTPEEKGFFEHDW